MATTKGSIVGRDVYDKRRGVMGRVVKEDGLSLVIEFSTADNTVTKTITPSTFKRWYRLLPEEPKQCESQEPATVEPENVQAIAEHTKGKGSVTVPDDQKGAVGVGSALCSLFLSTVKSTGNQDIEVKTTSDKRAVVVKYNGRNVFEITVCKRRLVVMCHPKSLSPANVKKVTKQYPKEFGWPLSSKFVFTDDSQLPLMRSIITDGLYYRQIINKEEVK